MGNYALSIEPLAAQKPEIECFAVKDRGSFIR